MIDDERKIQQRLAEIESREREVAARERALETKGVRYNLYDRITLSTRSVDAIIIVCAVLILASVVVGIIIGP